MLLLLIEYIFCTFNKEPRTTKVIEMNSDGFEDFMIGYFDQIKYEQIIDIPFPQTNVFVYNFTTLLTHNNINVLATDNLLQKVYAHTLYGIDVPANIDDIIIGDVESYYKIILGNDLFQLKKLMKFCEEWGSHLYPPIIPVTKLREQLDKMPGLIIIATQNDKDSTKAILELLGLFDEVDLILCLDLSNINSSTPLTSEEFYNAVYNWLQTHIHYQTEFYSSDLKLDYSGELKLYAIEDTRDFANAASKMGFESYFLPSYENIYKLNDKLISLASNS